MFLGAIGLALVERISLLINQHAAVEKLLR
jgi:hypothetical protein